MLIFKVRYILNYSLWTNNTLIYDKSCDLWTKICIAID